MHRFLYVVIWVLAMPMERKSLCFQMNMMYRWIGSVMDELVDMGKAGMSLPTAMKQFMASL